MKIVKPIYVNHIDVKENQKDFISSIYSIDFHPNGQKFTTGGGSDKFGIIKVWNMEPIRFNEKEMDDNCPKILFEDYSHLKCVNAIKWSPNGKYLASGSIDAVIIIWIQKKLNDLERKGKKFAESYRGAFQLRGHSQDVMDLAWSPHGSYLCSGSIDNKIIVWNAEKFPEKTVILSGHKSFIKGVCWDPLGRYLASQSEDKTLRIWRTSDWKQEIKLEDEIDKSHSRCCFNRFTWSPDGANVVATGTTNNGIPTAQLYNRDNWLKGVDMIGHRQHVICAKYFPTLLRCKDTNQEFLLLALGSKDRSLSVWTTLRRRPLTVVSDLFTMSIIDLSWFVDKFELLACSLDGTIAYLQFNEEELGTPLSSDEMTKHFEKIYGNGFVNETLSLSKSKSFLLPESSAVLELQRKQRELHNKGISGIPLITVEKQTGPKEQIVHRTQTGKRRITPKFISSIDDEDMEPEPVPVKKLATSSSSSVEQLSSTDNDTGTPKDEESSSDKPKLVSKHKLLEEKFVKPESPTVQPRLSSSDDCMNGFSSTTTSDSKDPVNGKSKVMKTDDIIIRSPKKTEESTVNKCPIPVEIKTLKKDDKLSDQDTKSNASNDNKLPRRLLLYKDTMEKLNSDSIKPLDTSTLTSLNVSIIEDSPKKVSRETKMTIAEKRPKLVQPIIKSGSSLVCISPGESVPYHVKTVNEGTTDSRLCTMSVCVGDHKLWDVTLTSPVSVVVHYKDKVFVGDVVGSLHGFLLKGGRLMVPFVLDSGIVHMTCDGKYLVTATSKATLFVWSLSPICLITKESFLHLVTEDSDKNSVKDITVNGDGNVSLIFDSGSAYIFNKMAGVWHEVYGTGNKCESWSLCRLLHSDVSGLPLAKMQSGGDEVTKTVKTDLRIDRLEIQMKLSETLHLAEEYKYWLIMLMRTLIDASETLGGYW